MYAFLDIVFLVFHSLLIFFILTGWGWTKSRRLHFLVLVLTFFSWLGLGFFYGIGYCPCTDWHWQIKRALGQTELPQSYVKYYLDRMTGSNWNPRLVDASVVLVALVALGVSVWLNWRDRHRVRSMGNRQSP